MCLSLKHRLQVTIKGALLESGFYDHPNDRSRFYHVLHDLIFEHEIFKQKDKEEYSRVIGVCCDIIQRDTDIWHLWDSHKVGVGVRGVKSRLEVLTAVVVRSSLSWRYLVPFVKLISKYCPVEDVWSVWGEVELIFFVVYTHCHSGLFYV